MKICCQWNRMHLWTFRLSVSSVSFWTTLLLNISAVSVDFYNLSTQIWLFTVTSFSEPFSHGFHSKFQVSHQTFWYVIFLNVAFTTSPLKLTYPFNNVSLGHPDSACWVVWMSQPSTSNLPVACSMSACQQATLHEKKVKTWWTLEHAWPCCSLSLEARTL